MCTCTVSTLRIFTFYDLWTTVNGSNNCNEHASLLGCGSLSLDREFFDAYHEDESIMILQNVRSYSLNNSGTSQRSWIVSNACVRTSNLHIKLRATWLERQLPPQSCYCTDHSQLSLSLTEVDCFHALCNVTRLHTRKIFYASKKYLY